VKTSVAVLAFVCLICIASQTLAQAHRGEPSAVNVPAGNLNDAVESLARQVGVDVMYPGNLLEGLRTRGVSGTHAPVEAFGRLLESTSLVLVEDDGALLISQATRTGQRIVASNALPQAGAGTPSNGVSVSPVSSGTDLHVCHRVSEHSKSRVYCGRADQWAELQTRVGFHCKKEGKRDELCASASEWKRLEFIQTQQALGLSYRNDEATQSALLNSQMFNGTATANVPNYTPPKPAPAPSK
jgi:hypothetical protein